MTTAMMIDRSAVSSVTSTTNPSTSPVAPNMVMVPRCTMKVEKCTNGVKIHCICEDATSSTMLQNLCTMLAGGICSFYCTSNGIVVCNFNLTIGTCKVEKTREGCCITCTSGDKACCELIQACCDCLCACLANGCACCVVLGGTPVCCCCNC